MRDFGNGASISTDVTLCKEIQAPLRESSIGFAEEYIILEDLSRIKINSLMIISKTMIEIT